MALTDVQRADVRFFLGWSARFHQFDSRLEQAMNAISTEPEAETLVLGEIAACKDIDTKLTAAHARLKALKVGSIGLSGPGEIQALRKEGKRHTTRMAAIFGVERRIDVFSSGSHGAFASFGGLQSSGNAMIKG